MFTLRIKRYSFTVAAIKTKNIDKLQILFMEKAYIIAGTKLQTIDKLSTYYTAFKTLHTLNKSPSTPGKINYKTLRRNELIFDNQEWELTELKNEIAELKIELTKLKKLVIAQNNSNNISVKIDEHVKQVINFSQKKSHDTLEKRISQTNALISNLQLDFKKTRDLLSDLN